MRLGRRQLRLVDGQHQFLSSRGGRRATRLRLMRAWATFGRVGHAVPGTDRHHGKRFRCASAANRSHRPTAIQQIVASKRRVSSGYRFLIIRDLSAAWFGMNDIASPSSARPSEQAVIFNASTTGSCACSTPERSARSSATRQASRCSREDAVSGHVDVAGSSCSSGPSLARMSRAATGWAFRQVWWRSRHVLDVRAQ